MTNKALVIWAAIKVIRLGMTGIENSSNNEFESLAELNRLIQNTFCVGLG